MRVRSLLAAGMALAMGASVADAAFQVTAEFSFGTGPGGSHVVRLFALNDGVGGTGDRLQSIDVTLSVVGPTTAELLVDFQDVDNDGAPDANILGQGTFPVATPPGTYIRNGGAGTLNVVQAPAGRTSDSDGDGAPDTVPLPTANPAFTDMKSLRIVGFQPNQAASPLATPAQNAGRGAQFAAAVVSPDTEWVRVVYNLAGLTGPGTSGELIRFPEPTMLGVLGLGVLGLTGRRRRA